MLLRKWLVILALLQFLAGCAVTGSGGSASANGQVAIPTHAFASNRAANFGYKIAPDGKKLAWIAVTGTSLGLFVKDLETGRIFKRTEPALMSFDWTEDSTRLITDGLLQNGSENQMVGVVSAIDSSVPMIIVSATAGASSRLVSQVAGDNNHVLVASNRRNRKLFDLFNVELSSRKHVLIAENDGFTRTWLASVNGALAGRIAVKNAQYTLYIQQPGGKAEVAAYQWAEGDNVTVLSITPDFASTYLLSNKNSDLTRLLRLDNASGTTELIHDDPLVDISAAYTDRVTGKPLAAVSEPDYPKNAVLDQRLSGLHDFAAPKLPARLAIENTDRLLRKVVFSLANDTGKDFFLADLVSGHIDQVGVASTQEFRAALRKSTPVEFAGRDGTLLRAYLTLPERHGERLPPLVLQPHGGPWARDVWVYDGLTQFLANRGYAVLTINFRGSAGYGRRFQALGHGEWGGKMQEDLYDGLAWAARQGLVAPGPAASIGYSYGGYATVMGLIQAPQLFSCGIAINAPMDLPDLVENLPAQWAFDQHLIQRSIGDPGNRVERATMLGRSPVALAATLERPLLLVQGADDVRVRAGKASSFAQAANRTGRKVELWSVPGEGHLLTGWRNVLKLYRKTEKFLSACAGGRDAGFDYYELGYLIP